MPQSDFDQKAALKSSYLSVIVSLLEKSVSNLEQKELEEIRDQQVSPKIQIWTFSLNNL